MEKKNKRDRLSIAGEVYTIIRVLREHRSFCLYIAVCNGNMYVMKEFAEESQYSDCIRTHEVLETIGVIIPKLLAVDNSSLICVEEYFSGLPASDYIMQGTLCSSILDQIKVMSELCEQHDIVLDYYPTKYIIHKKELVYIGCQYFHLTDDNHFQEKGLIFWMNAPTLIADMISRKERL